MTAAARELARLRYLSAMGVTPLVTRRALPGAAPTKKMAVRSPATNDAAVVGDPGVAAAPGMTVPSELRAMLAPANPAERATTNIGRTTRSNDEAGDDRGSMAAPPRSPAAEGGTIVERFRLSAIVCGGRLWIEDLGDGALAREQLELVTGMARALVHPGTVEAPQVQQFDWPMHNNEHLNLGQDEAAASLQGFLSRQLDEHACVELICLGDGARERTRSLNLPCASIALPATRVLLEEPRRKRDAWRDLRRS